MSVSAGPIIRLPDQCITLRVLLLNLMILVFTGCFGAGTMHYDIQQYNKEVLSSEKEMLLYNIAALGEGQSPHFTMVSNISASRTFTASSTFTFTNLWNRLFLPQKTVNTTKGSNTYAAGVTAGLTESPTITYLPIQGQDFGTRFESPITPDKLNIFLEDINLNPKTQEHEEWLMLLIAQDVEILHGDTECPEGPAPINKELHYDLFRNCVSHIIESSTDVSEIDANHVIVPSVVAKETHAYRGAQCTAARFELG
jgi:hypothetical protein